MPISNCISSVPLSNGDVLSYGRQKMIVPSGGNIARQCSFFISPVIVASPDEPGAKCSPTVLATVDNSGVGAGTIMTIYGVDFAPSENALEIKVSAVSLEDVPLDGDYFCNITVIGTPSSS
jgi:hypothetical protein